MVNLLAVFGRVTPVREASGGGSFGGYDPDELHTAAQLGSQYTTRLGERQNRDLSPQMHDTMLKVASYLFDSNGIAKRAIEIIRDFALGDGLAVTVADGDEVKRDELQSIIDEFWNDHHNKMDINVSQWGLDQSMLGELCLSVSVNPVNGDTLLGYVDPGAIQRVVCHPDWPTEPYQIVLKPPAAGEREQVLRVISPDDNPSSRWYGRLYGVETDSLGQTISTYRDDRGAEIPYDGACFFFPINKPSSGKRGRSDLLCSVDWADSLDQVVFGEVERSNLLKLFIWDVTLKGMSQPQVDEWTLKNGGMPRASTLRAHNDTVEYKAVSPELRSFEAKEVYDMILDMISTGTGVPKTWLNGTTDVNLATAREMSEFGFAKITQRQRLFRYVVEIIATFVLDQKERAGILAKRPSEYGRKPSRWAISVSSPEVRAKDMTAATEAYAKYVTSTIAAVEARLINEDTARRGMIIVLSQIGLDVDLISMTNGIEQDRIDDGEADDDGDMIPDDEIADDDDNGEGDDVRAA